MGRIVMLQTSGDGTQEFLVEASSEDEALRHHELPQMGQRHFGNMAKQVIERTVQRASHRLYRVTVIYDDPRIHLGAGI